MSTDPQSAGTDASPKRGRGRPFRIGGQRRERSLRLDDSEMDTVKQAAADAGVSTAEWMRTTLLAAAADSCSITRIS